MPQKAAPTRRPAAGRTESPVARKGHKTEGGAKAAASSQKKGPVDRDQKSKTSKPDQAAASPTPAPSSSSHPVASAVVYIGTYHNVAAAYSLRKSEIAPRFTAPSHVGAVVSVATCSRFFASSGSDESIAVQTVKENGTIFADLGKVAPPCQVNAMVFPDPRFLLCAFDNGHVALYKTREWNCGAVIRAHDKPCVGVAVHPSGRVGASIGNDYLITLLDLTRGALITHQKLDKSLALPIGVNFSPNGDFLVVQTRYSMSIFVTRTLTEVARATFDRDPTNEIQCFVLTPNFAPASATKTEASFSCVVAVESGTFHVFHFNPTVLDGLATDSGNAKLQRLVFSKVAVAEKAALPVQDASAVVEAGDEAGQHLQLRPRVRAMDIVNGTLFTGSSVGLLQVFDLASLKESIQQASSGSESATWLAAVERARVKTGGRITSLSVLKR